jgi:hypothetical protein
VKRLITLFGLALMLLAASLPAQAHKPSDSYLNIEDSGKGPLHGQWDIALRDLDYAIGLDGDGDGQLTWDEVRGRHGAIAAYALARLKLVRGGQACVLTPGEQLVDNHTDGAYTVLRFTAACAAEGRLEVDYRLFADVDPQHKGLVGVRSGATVRTLVLGADHPHAALDEGAAQGFLSYRAHRRLAYLDRLRPHPVPALAAAAGRADLARRRLASGPRPRAAVIDVLKIVTAFTLAHSITLSLAALGIVPCRLALGRIGDRPVRVLAALNNLLAADPRGGARWSPSVRPDPRLRLRQRAADLGLQPGALVLSLVGFNVGVEIGQLAIVLLFLPLAWLLRRTWFYRRVVLAGGSGLIVRSARPDSASRPSVPG